METLVTGFPAQQLSIIIPRQEQNALPGICFQNQPPPKWSQLAAD